ncbi:MAG TPA: dynamin family protein [Acidobacteriaceae bacterium]|nr:dynamin family protein [Acidobacteriaceae bacterium]
MARHPGQLNEHQQSRLRVTCQYIDKLLSDMEDILHAASSPSPFPRYIVDLNPAQIRVIEDHVRRLRSQLVHTLAWQEMKASPADIPATRAILTNLNFVDIAVEELRPRYMQGFGPVPDDAVGELNGVVHELRALVTGMERYLKQDLDKDLDKRLEQLERTGFDVVLLRLLEQVATRNGLVEFRLRIDALASRLEEDTFEVALFGRVSSGKSSLLNTLLGTDILPVGVNPITAVPTKLRYGKTLKAAIAYGDGRAAQVSVEELARLVTEQGNPGNLKNIVRALVEVPSPRLQHGIMLVDTPGLGSLARRGAAETLAYLPSCDLALLLIDAGATLNEEDIGTLRLLYEAGIPALVLLSKSDLLANGDLHRTISYIEAQLKHELHITAAVHPVSALSTYRVLLDQFFERELFPRFEKARSLREASTTRKIGAMREAIIAALDANLQREKRGMPRTSATTSDLESVLRVVTGEVGEQRTLLDHAFRTLGETPDAILETVANQATFFVRTAPHNQLPALQLSEWILEAINGSIQPSVEHLRTVGKLAVERLRQIASEMGRSDAPSQDDFEAILRNMPRFEMATLPKPFEARSWKIWGKKILHSRIKASLRASIGSHLENELHLYGMALSQWSDQIVRKLELLVNSYADAYRMQIQRVRATPDSVVDRRQLETDLELLQNWRPANKGALTDTHA